VAKEIMVPRTEMITISIEDEFDEIMKTVEEENYTRYPVVNGDKDHIIGYVNMKEFLTAKILDDGKNHELSEFVKPVMHVIENIPIHDLLVKMQKERTHIAIIMDEYGGTSGLVTVEDILEEIVGEIRDEFDDDEVPEIRKVKEDEYILDAKMLLEDVNDLLGIELISEDIDTIGGWILSQNFEAEVGTEAEAEGYTFKIDEKDGHQVLYIEVKKIA
jgi:CBS domain containing-hemolysin-like protein